MSEGCCTHEEMPFQGSRQSEQPPNQGLKPFPGLHKGSLPKPPAPRRLKDFTSMAPFRKEGGRWFPCDTRLKCLTLAFLYRLVDSSSTESGVKNSFFSLADFSFCITCWLIFAFQKNNQEDNLGCREGEGRGNIQIKRNSFKKI